MVGRRDEVMDVIENVKQAVKQALDELVKEEYQGELTSLEEARWIVMQAVEEVVG